MIKTHSVEALKEGEAVDEVETFTGRRANAVDDEVNVVGRSSDYGVEGTRPRLSIGSELERRLWQMS